MHKDDPDKGSSDPNKGYVDTRASLRDTAKWIVSILGAALVLVVGGGLVAKIPDLDSGPRFISAFSLLVVAGACLFVLSKAIDIVASRTTPLVTIATNKSFAVTRSQVNELLKGYYPEAIDTVEKLHDQYLKSVAVANDNRYAPADRDKANKFLSTVQPRIREVIELCNTAYLQLKFDRLKVQSRIPLLVIAVALVVFLFFSHKDDGTEKALAKPTIIAITWSADAEAALNKAGMDPACYSKTRPQLIQIAERSGLRAVVVAVPDRQVGGCRPVRVLVNNENKVSPAD